MVVNPLSRIETERPAVTTIKDIKNTDDSEKMRTGRYILAWRYHRNITLAAIIAEGAIAVIVLLLTSGLVYEWSLAVTTTITIKG
jgi:hypothetical protein